MKLNLQCLTSADLSLEKEAVSGCFWCSKLYSWGVKRDCSSLVLVSDHVSCVSQSSPSATHAVLSVYTTVDCHRRFGPRTVLSSVSHRRHESHQFVVNRPGSQGRCPCLQLMPPPQGSTVSHSRGSWGGVPVVGRVSVVPYKTLTET